MSRRIAIQGYKGCFHEQAARLFYASVIPGEVEESLAVVECDTFEGLYTALEEGRADAAVMAIENTVSGGLLHNFDLLRKKGRRVKGEVYTRIGQNLMSLPIPGREWQYFFYIDIKFADYLRYTQALAAVRPLIEDLEVLGEYKSAL